MWVSDVNYFVCEPVLADSRNDLFPVIFRPGRQPLQTGRSTASALISRTFMRASLSATNWR